LVVVGGGRLARAAPGRSLLLLKATLAIPHGGGLRLAPGSPALEIVTRWLALGAPGPVTGERTIAALEVFPGERLLQRGQGQQVRVTARYSDGRARDVTRLARYTSGSDAIAAVDEAGLTRAGGPGAAAVMVRYQGQAAVVRLAVPFSRLGRYPDVPAANYVDSHVQREWRRLGLLPSAGATDAEFLRRVSLDLTGTLPTPERLDQFLAEVRGPGSRVPSPESRVPGPLDPQPAIDARARLVDQLLDSPEWIDFWTMYFADLLRNTQRTSGEKGMWAFHNWLRASLRQDKPYNQMVRELIAGHGSATRDGAANFYNTAKTPEELAETAAQVFLGVRLQCARCHNHPFEKWTQADYYGLAAFFPGVTRKQSGEETLVLHTAAGTVKHPSTGQVMEPRPPDGPVRKVPGEERLTALADWMADPANPFVARSIVNRVWARLMGRGLIDPVDDLRVSNPPTHPELLDALTRDFVQNGFSLKRLMRVIVSSRAYQLSSRPTPQNGKDDRFYSHYRARRLMAEQLLDAIGQATGRPEKFPGFPAGYRAISLPDPSLARAGLLDVFGRPQRATPCECERSSQPSLTQTLFLINSDFTHNKIADPKGAVAAMLAAGNSDEKIVRRLYAAAFTRYPTPEETAAAVRFVGEAAGRQEGLEDVLWTLLNSQEFLLQH
jgi:hypothetical protein